MTTEMSDEYLFHIAFMMTYNYILVMEDNAMARKTRITEGSLERARDMRDHAQRASDVIKALAFLLPAETNLLTAYVARILGISKRTLFRYQDEIRSQDSQSKASWGGRRNAHLTQEQEKAFLETWVRKAEQGGVLTVPPIHQALVELVGFDFPISSTYRLLARHGWRKVEPDTRHPQSDPQAQEEFKKNSLRPWRPPVKKT